MRKLIGCLILLAGIAPGALASQWSVSLAPGFAIPMGDTAEVMGNDFAIDGSLERAITSSLSLGLEAGYSSHDLEGSIDGISFDSDIHASFLHATPYLKFGHDFEVQTTKLRAFVFGGFGYYRLHSSEGTIIILNSRVPAESTSDQFSGMNLGAGFDIPLDDDYTAGVSIHYHRVFEPGSDDQLFVPGVRLSYLF